MAPGSGAGIVLEMDGRRDITVTEKNFTMSLSVIPGDGQPGSTTRAELELVGSDSVEAPDEMPDELHETFKEVKRRLTRDDVVGLWCPGSITGPVLAP